MYSVTKTFRVSCGHRLSKHPGLCKNFHGHNLKIEVTVSSRTLDENGMVIDFSSLKKEIEGIVTDWDHALFLNVNDIEWAEFMKQKEMKVVIVPGEPTAERMCSELFITLREKMRSLERPVHIKRVRIWENDDSMAEYES